MRDRLFTVTLITLGFILGVFIGAPNGAYAQATGSLRGQVLDPTGAVVQGASVSVTGTGQNRTTVTDGQGAYQIEGLPPGQYNVSARAKGFADHVLPKVGVTAGQSRAMNVTLEIAVEKEEVQVQD